MFEDIIAEQNPHWQGILYPKGIHRECFKEIVNYLEIPHVISMTGVRRGGKSTLLKQTINYLIEEKKVPPTNLFFCNLEHPYFSQYSDQVKYLENLFEDYLKLANPKGKIYCFLDEIQFFHRWPVFIKAHYEQKKVKFMITGSNSFLISHDLLTLLSGRTLPVEVYPLSFSELIAEQIKKPVTRLILSQYKQDVRRLLDRFLKFGGFPEIALLANDDLANDILNSYAKTILYQDVASRLNLKKPLDLEKLFYYLTSHIGNCFSYSSLAELFDISDKTIKDYLKALVDANLLFEVNQFSYSLKKQIRAHKKVYSIDTGMANAIAFKFTDNHGKLFENVIFLELKRRKKEIYYYKTASDCEVDFVVKDQKKIDLIQVCIDLHEKAEMRELKALIQAAQELKLKQGTLITADVEKNWMVEGIAIKAIPLYKWANSYLST